MTTRRLSFTFLQLTYLFIVQSQINTQGLSKHSRSVYHQSCRQSDTLQLGRFQHCQKRCKYFNFSTPPHLTSHFSLLIFHYQSPHFSFVPSSSPSISLPLFLCPSTLLDSQLAATLAARHLIPPTYRHQLHYPVI